LRLRFNFELNERLTQYVPLPVAERSELLTEKTAAALLDVAGMPVPPWEHLSS
jgi:hypothetical protein